MPLPKDMEKCMHKVKKEFPEGRSDKKKSKKGAHKQHVAMCLSVKENMTFMEYLLVEQESMHIRDAIAHLKKEGKKITPKNIAKVLGVPVSTVKRAAHPLSVVFPEIRKAFNTEH